MKLILKSEVVASAPKLWAMTYSKPMWAGDKGKQDITRKLFSTAPLTEEAITRIIGNDSWTSLTCDECGNSVNTLARVGQEPDYDSHTASLCVECITKAYELIKGSER